MSRIGGLRRRRSLALVGAATAVLLAALAVAYACTNVAVITLDRTKARPGRTVHGTGKYFRSQERDAGPVQIHFNDIEGNVVAETTVDPAMTPAGARCCDIAFEFAVPKVRPGWYTIIATQYRVSTGAPAYGTPARTVLKVRRAR